jgi:hypothetical protein
MIYVIFYDNTVKKPKMILCQILLRYWRIFDMQINDLILTLTLYNWYFIAPVKLITILSWNLGIET